MSELPGVVPTEKPRLPTRQVHLDFHTSEHISGIGERFSKEQWQQALSSGRVNSINVFAKGHHGWSYYPTGVGQVHPALIQTGNVVFSANPLDRMYARRAARPHRDLFESVLKRVYWDPMRLAELKLDAAPVWDGMAAADGCLLLALRDGSVCCFR